MPVSTVLILFVIVFALLLTFVVSQLIHDHIGNQELHHQVRVIDKQVETGQGIYPVTSFNGYGYTTRYVSTNCTKYRVAFLFTDEVEPMELRLYVSKKQYDTLNLGDTGSLLYCTGAFKRFDPV